jgi:hypothetical protein
MISYHIQTPHCSFQSILFLSKINKYVYICVMLKSLRKNKLNTHVEQRFQNCSMDLGIPVEICKDLTVYIIITALDVALFNSYKM